MTSYICEQIKQMKQFFKFFTASCLGVFAAFGCVLLALIIFGSIAGLLADDSVKSNTILELEFDHAIKELNDNIVVSPFDFDVPDAIGLQDFVQTIEHAATDQNIKGIYINATNVGAAPATLSVIKDALLEFKESGKFIYAYSDYYSQSAYYIASTADSIYTNVNGSVDLKGFGTIIPFYKEAMDAIGFDMNIFYAGNFKSATEPYRGTEMSENSRLQTTQFLNEMWDIFKTDIADNRSMNTTKLDSIVNVYGGYSAKAALRNQLIDEILYRDEVEDKLKSILKIKEKSKLKMIGITEYRTKSKFKKSSADDQIAVVYMEGTVEYGNDDNGNINDQTFPKILEKLAKKEEVKAVVLRVNSPGGSSVTSDLIWHATEKLKASGKKVIASYGDYAASGGYYVSCGADTIVSMPNTLTGSIGVFMMLPNAQKMLNEKLGIHFDTVKTAPMATAFQPMLKMRDQEKEILNNMTQELYEQFLSRVADGRNMTRDEVHEVAQGRVWTGTKAKEIGLVDEIGDLDRAIEIAAAAANLDEYKLVSYPKIAKEQWREILKSMSKNTSISTPKLTNEEQKLWDLYQTYKPMITDTKAQMRLPYHIEWN